jgi:glycosyltransferase involved in cell wall biosynthesis
MITRDARILFSHGNADRKASVIVPLYNYANYIVETLESVRVQTFRDLAIIVIDDCSKDDSAAAVTAWMEKHKDCGLTLVLLQNTRNARLAITRNTGIAHAQSEYCFFLDADNTIYPRCLEKHVAALDSRPDAAAAYSLIEVFDGRSALMGASVFSRAAFKHGNYLDAMAMVRRSVLLEFDGFHHIDYGWEDYDLWLRLCEAKHFALHIPEILSRYREHAASMLRTDTNLPDHIRKLRSMMTERHPWLDLH